MGWTVVTYRLPKDDSRARVAVWRQVRRSGALHLQQSVVALPDGPAFAEDLEELRATITEVGGEDLAIRGDADGPDGAARLVALWNEARDDEYRELIRETDKFLKEIDHEFAQEKFTLAELEEEEAELDKLDRWHGRIRRRDVHGAAEAGACDDAMGRAREALERYSAAVFEHTEPPA
ncbi:MAG: Chromate resistance protein ChrB [Thermoleophilia bacterium]